MPSDSETPGGDNPAVKPTCQINRIKQVQMPLGAVYPNFPHSTRSATELASVYSGVNGADASKSYSSVCVSSTLLFNEACFSRMSAKPQTNLRHAIRLQRCYCQPNRSFRHSPQQRHGHLQILPNQTRTRRSFTKLLPTPKRKINSLRIPQRRWRDQKPDYSQYFRFQDSPKSALRTAHSQSNPRLRILTGEIRSRHQTSRKQS